MQRLIPRASGNAIRALGPFCRADQTRLIRITCNHAALPSSRDLPTGTAEKAAGKSPSIDQDDVVEVLVIDPRLVLETERLEQLEEPSTSAVAPPYVSLRVPITVLPLLSQGQQELSDMDDPMNTWLFGKRGELFQYRFAGSHAVASGMTSILVRDELEKLRKAKPAVDWAAFMRMHNEGIHYPNPDLPFLFAGNIVHSESASVYELSEGGLLQGLMLTSDAEELD